MENVITDTSNDIKIEDEFEDNDISEVDVIIKGSPLGHRSYEELPHLGDEKPMIGPSDPAGIVPLRFKTMIDGCDIKLNELRTMEALGLPTGFQYGSKNKLLLNIPGGLRSKKSSFYCLVCNVELNSEESMKSHMNGGKHLKVSVITSLHFKFIYALGILSLNFLIIEFYLVYFVSSLL